MLAHQYTFGSTKNPFQHLLHQNKLSFLHHFHSFLRRWHLNIEVLYGVHLFCYPTPNQHQSSSLANNAESDHYPWHAPKIHMLAHQYTFGSTKNPFQHLLHQNKLSFLHHFHSFLRRWHHNIKFLYEVHLFCYPTPNKHQSSSLPTTLSPITRGTHPKFTCWLISTLHILKLIYEPNIICLVIDNLFLVDNAHKLIYKCLLFCPRSR